MRKFQAFDRTRLFGPDWKVTSIWTTLSVPWTLEYHDTKFAFTLAKPGPVVIVLSQLDDRYFRGLEGQYRFELNFRVHRAGEDDYLVRTQHSSRMNRSINVELDLDAGEYLVLVKIDATRNEWVLPTEDVVRNNARHHREKLLRIGLSYDLAHSKAKIKESPEEKAAREAHEQRKKDKQRESLRKAIMEEKEINFYNRMKSYQRQKRRMDKNKERMKRKAEKRKAKMEKKKAKREEERKQTEETCSDPLGKQKKEGKDSGFSLDAALHPAGERMAPLTVDTAASTDAGQPTQSVSSTGATEVDVADRLPEPVLPDSLEKDIKAPHGPLTEILTPHSAPTQQQGCGLSGKDDKPSPEQPNEASAQDPIEVRPGPSMDIHKTLEDAPQHSQSPRPTCGESGRGADRTRAIENKLRAAVNLFSNLKQELELMLEKGVSNDSIKQGHGQKPHDVDNQGQPPPPSPTLRPPAEQRTLQPPMPSSPRPFPPPHPQDQRRQRPLPQLRDRSPRHPQIDPGPSPRRSQQRYGGRPPQRREVFIDDGHRIPPDPRFVDDSFSESSSSSADTDDTYSISSISDISDRELDMHIREDARRNGRLLDQGSRNQAILPPLQPQPGPPQPIQPGPIGPGPHPRIRGREPRHRHGGRGRDGHRNELVDPNAEFEKNPWNAVAVVGLRVYYRVDQDDAATIIGDKDAAGVVKGEKEKREMVKLKVSRPNPWETGSDDEKDTKKKKEEEERESKWTRGLKKNKKSKTAEEEKNKKGDGGVEAGGNVGGAGCDGELKKEEVEKVLDVDDSAKDATLEGGEREKTVAEGQV